MTEPLETEEAQRVVVRDKRRIDPDSGELREGVPAADPSAAGTVEPSATTDADRQLEERTADLQRVKAEYDNYRRRVERDRAAMAEQAVAAVLVHLLPVLDDIDRAEEHGELVGGFRSVADTLTASMTKLGLERIGVPGEPFDPLLHEAVTHAYSDDVTEPTCVDVMRPGYRYAERLIRPAMVAVAEPGQADEN